MDLISRSSLFYLFDRASRITDQRLHSEQPDRDLNMRHLIVLAAIAQNEGASQTTIANKTGIDRSTMADIANRLHQKKLVGRRRTPSDARAYELSITASGMDLLKEAQARVDDADKALKAVLSGDEQAELVRLLDKIIQNGGDLHEGRARNDASSEPSI